jgi:transcriptional regulator with XRE-family HTH domain
MKSSRLNQQLGDFLRKRREKLKPKDVGLPSGNRRRTPGLRREEVAELAGISTDWYVRLEQGRDTLPSPGTVNALAKALSLTPNERSHLHNLAAGHVNGQFGHERVPPFLAALVHDMPLPAYIIGARFDLLCWNRAAVETFRDFSLIPENERNTLYQMFLCREVRETYPNWATDARAMLESFRATYDLMSHVPEFVSLKDELCSRSSEFRSWWEEHGIRAKLSGEKSVRHRRLGLVTLRHSTFESVDCPGLKLVIYNFEKNTRHVLPRNTSK